MPCRPPPEQPTKYFREAAELAEAHPEVVLTGVHIGSYGVDCGTSLGALVEATREVLTWD